MISEYELFIHMTVTRSNENLIFVDGNMIKYIHEKKSKQRKFHVYAAWPHNILNG